jgi:hypothetical protein
MTTFAPTAVRASELARFRQKIALQPDGCWLWQGALLPNGYGRFHGSVSNEYAHRAAYRLYVGTIPVGLQIDHRCRVRHCVKPTHLEAVTQRENLLRGDTIVARNAAKTTCVRGHEFTHRNSYGHRACRTCLRAKEERRAAERKAARHARGLKRAPTR